MSNILKSENNEVNFNNTFTVSGRIIYKAKFKESTLFVILVRKKLKDKEEFIYTKIPVLFKGSLAITYNEMFEKRDEVIITGVCQCQRNHTFIKDEVKLYGLFMSSKIRRRKNENGEPIITKVPDIKTVRIRGKVDKTIIVSNTMAIVYIYTNVNKEFNNPNNNSDTLTFSRQFISRTPVFVYLSEDKDINTNTLADKLNKGVWVDIQGYLNTTEKEFLNGEKLYIQKIVANNLFILPQNGNNIKEETNVNEEINAEDADTEDTDTEDTDTEDTDIIKQELY